MAAYTGKPTFVPGGIRFRSEARPERGIESSALGNAEERAAATHESVLEGLAERIVLAEEREEIESQFRRSRPDKVPQKTMRERILADLESAASPMVDVSGPAKKRLTAFGVPSTYRAADYDALRSQVGWAASILREAKSTERKNAAFAAASAPEPTAEERSSMDFAAMARAVAEERGSSVRADARAKFDALFKDSPPELGAGAPPAAEIPESVV